MLEISGVFARFALAVAVAASLSDAGCSSSAVRCPCPSGGLTNVTVPAAESTSIAVVSTDPPCTARDGGGGIVVVERHSVGTCQVSVQLASGDAYAFSVQFRTNGSGCCPDLVTAVDASVPALVDAGTGG